MTALAADRNVPRHGAARHFCFPQKGSTTLFRGALCVLNGGYLAPGTATTGLVVAGVYNRATSINSGADGAVKDVEVETGVWPFKNSSAGDLIAQADVGNDCYIVDDQTVAKTNGSSSRSRAGKIISVDTNWVWVLVGITE